MNVHAHNVHKDKVDYSKPSRCVDNTMHGTHDNHDHSHRINHHPCESEVVAMVSGCHHACSGEASPNEGDPRHLAHGGATNRSDDDKVVDIIG
jgi:hypothetical protein